MNTYFLSGLLMAATFTPLLADDSLTPNAPVEVTGTQGRFDFIKIDASRHRLLACHTGNGSLDIIDLNTSKLIKSVPTGNAQGVAVDDKGGRYFVSASKPSQMVTIDADKLAVTGTVPLPDPADVDAYNPATDRVFVCNDTKPEIWVIDPTAQKIEKTLTLPGSGMEDLGFSDDSKCLFQCLKDTGALEQVDAAQGTPMAQWPTTPAEKPHGLAIVTGAGSVLIAGGNGKAVLISQTDGKVQASADIAPKVDEIAYDPGLGRAYFASGTGTISIVDVGAGKLTAAGSASSAPGCHSIAVDPSTHTVWVVYAKGMKPPGAAPATPPAPGAKPPVGTPVVQSFTAK